MKKTDSPKKMNSLIRVVRLLIKAYPVMVPIVGVCILIAAVTASLPAIFQQQIYAVIGRWVESGDWASASKEITPKITVLVILYSVSLLAGLVRSQLMAVITQGFLNKMRQQMFAKMQNLPIRYFDTNKHGDIMSHYTNDIDTLRQMISQSIPTVIRCTILLTSVLCIMLYYSFWLTLVVLGGVAAMLYISRRVASGSTKYFIRQQRSMGKTEGYIQEMMTGQKVVKVFNHEEQCRTDFRKVNNELCEDAWNNS